MIEHLTIENFKIHRHFDPPRDFGRFNVLIGPNGVGKSSVFQAMELLHGLVQEHLGVYIKDRGWSYDDLPNLRDKSKSITIKARIALFSKDGRSPTKVEYEVKIVPRRYLTIGFEKVAKLGDGQSGTVLLERQNRLVRILDESRPQAPLNEMQFLGASSAMAVLNDPYDKTRYRTLSELRKFLEGIRHYTIWNPDDLRQGTKRLQPKLEPSGRNLPSVIGYLERNAPNELEKLLADLRKQFPWLEGIASKGGPYGSRTLLVKAKQGRRSQQYRASQVSDGFLRVLALATMTYQGDKPTVLAFEEPENGVHPQLLRVQVESLRRLASGAAGYAPQVFLATHSPSLLDFVPLESVLVMTADRLGNVQIRPVNKNAPLLHDAGLLPGEAWAYRGEKALTAGSKTKKVRKQSRDTTDDLLASTGAIQEDKASE